MLMTNSIIAHPQPTGRSAVRTTNPSEIIAIKKLESDGFEVIKNGWPDFLAFNKITNEIKFVEVKPGKKRLKPRQEKMAHIFSLLGLDYLVWNIDHGSGSIKEKIATGKPSIVVSHHRKVR